MKRHQFFLMGCIIFSMTCLMAACSKESTSENISVITKEEALVFTINPDPGANVFSVLGASQEFTITISSKLPAQGVNAVITVSKELDGVVVFSQNLSTIFSNFNSTIQNLQNGVVCNASIKLTSKSDSSNVALKNFKLARK